MAFKRSAVRSRLSPPKETVTERWLFSFAEMGSPYTADLLLFNPIAATAAERRLVPGGDSIPLISARRIMKGLISSEIKPFLLPGNLSHRGALFLSSSFGISSLSLSVKKTGRESRFSSKKALTCAPASSAS